MKTRTLLQRRIITENSKLKMKATLGKHHSNHCCRKVPSIVVEISGWSVPEIGHLLNFKISILTYVLIKKGEKMDKRADSKLSNWPSLTSHLSKYLTSNRSK